MLDTATSSQPVNDARLTVPRKGAPMAKTLANVQKVADFIATHKRRPNFGSADAEERRVASLHANIREYHPDLAEAHGISARALAPMPRANAKSLGPSSRMQATAQAVEAFIKAHDRHPQNGAVDYAEHRLGSEASRIRRDFPDLAEKHGFLVTIKPRPRPVTKAYLAKAQEIQAFIAERGYAPSGVAKDAAERSLSSKMRDLRVSCPALAREYGFAADMVPVRPATQVSATDGRRKPKALTFGHLLISWVRDGLLHRGGRALSETAVSEPLVCQATSLARVNSEIERDCWWFTLEGQDFPDPRTWHELRMSGDCTLIVKATRVAYLDFAALPEKVAGIRAPRRPY